MPHPVKIAFFGLLLLLGACGAPAATTTRFEPPPRAGGRLCAVQCGEAHDACNETCSLTERGCTNEMQSQAIHDYDQYARQQFAAHQPMDLMPRDFERPEKCKPVGCLASCERDYEACYERCGGKVVTETSCQAFCF
jgi:hypothetical protein